MFMKRLSSEQVTLVWLFLPTFDFNRLSNNTRFISYYLFILVLFKITQQYPINLATITPDNDSKDNLASPVTEHNVVALTENMPRSFVYVEKLPKSALILWFTDHNDDFVDIVFI